MTDRILSLHILCELENMSGEFSRFQKKSKLLCPAGCGKCCENPDIHCSPYELLPMAYHLLDTGKAEHFLELAKEKIGKSCLFLINDQCTHYNFRPYICRSFGVAARYNKSEIELAICRVLKEKYKSDTIDIENIDNQEIPFIEILRRQFESIDPVLSDKQLPINQALLEILEKVLLRENYINSPE